VTTSTKRRKILEGSSKIKNHNGGKKTPQNELYHKKLKELQIILSNLMADLKNKGCHPSLELDPKNESGKIIADFAVDRLESKKERILLIKLYSKSLNVMTTFLKGKNPSEVRSFDDFLRNLKDLKEKLEIFCK